MKNWERILKLREEYTHYPFYNEIYDWCPLEIREKFDTEYKNGGYREYKNERDLFDEQFKECFVNFLRYVKHWSLDSLIEFCGLSHYVRSTALRYLRNYKQGDNIFELWLLAEEGLPVEIPTKQREKIYNSSTIINPEDDLMAAIKSIRKQNKCLSYLMYLHKDGVVDLKVGKTSNITNRINQLKKQYKLDNIEVIKTFDFDDDETAEMMESFMRKYYKAKYPNSFIPKDRFNNGICTDKELCYFEKKAKLIAAAAEL